MDRIKKLSNQLGKSHKAFTVMTEHSYGDVLRKMRRSKNFHLVKDRFAPDGVRLEDEHYKSANK